MTLKKRTPRGRFVYQKINKIRWRPTLSQSGRISGSLFVTGSWDDDNNAVKLWSWDLNEDDVRNNSEKELAEPELKGTYRHDGDVNELQFLNPDVVVCASSDGSVTALRISRELVGAPTENQDGTGWCLSLIHI